MMPEHSIQPLKTWYDSSGRPWSELGAEKYEKRYLGGDPFIQLYFNTADLNGYYALASCSEIHVGLVLDITETASVWNK